MAARSVSLFMRSSSPRPSPLVRRPSATDGSATVRANAFSSAPRSPRANHCGSGISYYRGGLWHVGRPHRWPVEVTEAPCETNFVKKLEVKPMAEREVVLGLAAEIISAHVSNNAMQTDQLPGLIQQVFNTLSTIEQKSVAPPRPEPAVPVKKSVLSDRIICLDCGKHFSMIKRHLMTDHKLTIDQYRRKWGLPYNYPVVSPNYAKTRSALAKKFGLGRKSSATMKAAATAAG